MKTVVVTACMFTAMTYRRRGPDWATLAHGVVIGGGQTGGTVVVYRETFTLPFGPRFKFDAMVTECAEPERLAIRAPSSLRYKEAQ